MTEEAINAPEKFSAREEQLRQVNELCKKIEVHAFLMNRALDNGDLGNAMGNAIILIEILSTETLTPRNYYTLYHLVSTYLLQLNIAFQDDLKIPTRKIAEMYETVQYHNLALIRLYLMITIAPELSRRNLIRIVDVLDDLSDMTRQAQDPIRALFLRHFMLSIFKQYFPDSNEAETEISLDFLLNNFAQMNRLWVRIEDIMAHDDRRDERVDLSVLIGTNIQRLSALRGLNVSNYSTIILPFLSKHVELCEDSLAQEFILQSIIQAFPEDYHIVTVDDLFAIFGKVEQGVKILSIVNQLLERFLHYLGHLIDTEQSTKIFILIAKNIEELFNSEGHLALTDKFDTLQRLLKFALKINPNDVKNVQNLMKFTEFHIDLAIGDDILTAIDQSIKLRGFLEIVLTSFTSGDSLFEIQYLPVLIRRLRPEDRMTIAALACDLLLKSGTKIKNADQLNFVLAMTATLVRDGPGASCFFALFHLIDAGSIMETMALIQELANAMDDVTERASYRAILPIGFIALRLIPRATDEEKARLLKFIHAYGQNMSDGKTIAPFYLYLETAKMMDVLGYERFTNEFAITSLEMVAEYRDSSHKYRALQSLTQFVVGSDYVDLSINAQLCNTISLIPDQNKLLTCLCNCGTLFWRMDERIREPDKVQACLAKASKASASLSDTGQLLKGLYTVLGWAAYFQSIQVGLSENWLLALVSLISEKHEEITSRGSSIDAHINKNVKAFYVNTVQHIHAKHLFPDDE